MDQHPAPLPHYSVFFPPIGPIPANGQFPILPNGQFPIAPNGGPYPIAPNVTFVPIIPLQQQQDADMDTMSSESSDPPENHPGFPHPPPPPVGNYVPIPVFNYFYPPFFPFPGYQPQFTPIYPGTIPPPPGSEVDPMQGPGNPTPPDSPRPAVVDQMQGAGNGNPTPPDSPGPVVVDPMPGVGILRPPLFVQMPPNFGVMGAGPPPYQAGWANLGYFGDGEPNMQMAGGQNFGLMGGGPLPNLGQNFAVMGGGPPPNLGQNFDMMAGGPPPNMGLPPFQAVWGNPGNFGDGFPNRMMGRSGPPNMAPQPQPRPQQQRQPTVRPPRIQPPSDQSQRNHINRNRRYYRGRKYGDQTVHYYVGRSHSGVILTPLNHCKLCHSNGEREDVYMRHTLRGRDGKVSCPILRRLVCTICGETGDNAHTFKYCPFNHHVPEELRSFNFEEARADVVKTMMTKEPCNRCGYSDHSDRSNHSSP